MDEDMDVVGLRLHASKGDPAGYRSVTVRADWRIVLRFEGADIVDVDLTDDH